MTSRRILKIGYNAGARANGARRIGPAERRLEIVLADTNVRLSVSFRGGPLRIALTANE